MDNKLENMDKTGQCGQELDKMDKNWTKWTKLDYKNKSGHKLDIKCMIHNR